MPDVIGGVHVRDGLEDPQLNELADMVYSAISSGLEPGTRVASGDLALREA
jgi:hypothetical protein